MKHDLRYRLGKLVNNNQMVVNTLKKDANSILGSLNQSDSMTTADTECAISHSSIAILIKIEQGNLVYPDDIYNKDAFMMDQLQRQVKYYLLTRYARRSNRKSTEQYQKEISQSQPGQKVTKYRGHRFESTGDIDDYADYGANLCDDSYLLERENLIKILLEMDLSNRDTKILGYRLEGYTYSEIAALMTQTKTGKPATPDTIRVEYTRAMKKAGINVNLFKTHSKNEPDCKR